MPTELDPVPELVYESALRIVRDADATDDDRDRVRDYTGLPTSDVAARRIVSLAGANGVRQPD